MRGIALVLAVLVVLIPAIAGADEVTLKNGDKVTGRLVGLKGGKLSLETAHSGMLTIDWAQVASVKTDTKATLVLTTGENLEGTLSPGENGMLKLQSEGVAQPIVVDPTKVKSVNAPPVQWHGMVDIAARATDGNTHNKGVVAQAEGIYETEASKALLKGIFRYASDSGDLNDQYGYGIAKYQHNVFGDLYGYGSFEIFHDKFKDVRAKEVVSAGLGYLFFKDWLFFHDLSVEAGVAYIRNNFYVEDDESHIGARIASHVRVSLPLGLELIEDVTVYANFEHNSDWQLHNEASISTEMGKGWAFRVGVITDLDMKVLAGIERRDDVYYAGVSYKF